MAATLTLDTITSSGSEIEIPTGKTLVIADAGALKINNIAITTGAQGVLSKTTAYTILAADFTGKSSLIVFVNVSSGTDTETIITLPAAADFSTCAIHVISTTAHGSGNKITIKNISALEQYTLYAKGDHVEFVSDATNIFRTGNEFCTVLGVVYLTSQQYIAANGRLDVFAISGSSSYNVEADIGKGWSTTNDDYTVPQTGYYVFDGMTLPTTGSYVNSWQIYNVTQTKEYNYVNPGWNLAYGNSDQLGWPMHATKGDVLTFWVAIHSTATYVLGGSGNSQGSKIGWHLLRRD